MNNIPTCVLNYARIAMVGLLLLSLGVMPVVWNSPAQALWRRNVLTQLGDWVTPISPQQEVMAGVQLDRTIREKYPPSEDQALQAYVSRVGKKIAARTGQNYPFSYTVLSDTRSANAFTGPGGFVYITSGLINMLENEAQLAAVLAHETGHGIKRHVVKHMLEKNATELFVATISQLTEVNLNTQLTGAAQYVLFQKFSRQDELEADVLGTQLMTKAGYNPRGMVQLLDKLNALDGQGVVISFLQSHPAGDERAKVVQEAINRGKLEKPGQILDTREFHTRVH